MTKCDILRTATNSLPIHNRYAEVLLFPHLSMSEEKEEPIPHNSLVNESDNSCINIRLATNRLPIPSRIQ